jgi:beta-glucanase (GH16 family)
MRNIFIVLTVFLGLNLAAYAEEWTLHWSDEFDGAGIDASKWSFEVGKKRNQEAQYYTEARHENARIEDGCLVIEARQEEFEGSEYTSASLHTARKVHFLYGRIEVRAKIPTGRGMWPAVWMMGIENNTRWPDLGEIDILENVGYDPDVIHANVHSKQYNHTKGNGRGNKIEVDAPYNDFHMYAVEWFPDHMDFFYDEQKYFTVVNDGTGKDSWPFDAGHYLILNAAVGGSWGGQKGIDDSIFPQKYLIDYVRVYKQVKDDIEIGTIKLLNDNE